MMKKVINKNSGVTLVSLAIAVTVILILTGIIIYNVRDNLGISNLREMQSDIQNLRDLVSNYYSTNGQIPAKLKYTNTENIERIRTAGVISEEVDIGDFYIIDLRELENLTLNYGEDYKNISDATTEDEASQYEDIYIINETSQNIFYVAGIQLDGEMFYTDYTSEDVDEVAVNLRYFDGVKIPEGYIYNSGTSKEDLSIIDKDDATKIYNWVITDQDIEEIPSGVQVAEDEQADFIKSVNLFDGYYKSSTDNTVVYIVNEEKWSPTYDVDGTYTDKNGDTATIPAGFQVSEKKGETLIDEGLVIQDEEGNQFVWIPVDDINEMVQCSTAGGDCNIVLNGDTISCTTHSNTNLVGKLYATSTGENFTANTPNITFDANGGLREPAIVTGNSSGTGTSYDGSTTYLNIINVILGTSYSSSSTFLADMQEDFYDMAKSVAKYHGFYIGRYEMSRSDSNTAQSKANRVALTADNDNTNADMNGNTWYGLYAYGKTYTNTADSVVSSMVWGSQYDATMRWMQYNGEDVKSANDDKKNTNETTTGPEGDTDVVRNVYDLYGGRRELTLEANDTNYRVRRGRLLLRQLFTL